LSDAKQCYSEQENEEERNLQTLNNKEGWGKEWKMQHSGKDRNTAHSIFLNGEVSAELLLTVTVI
jgi:hypothetical protein